jgi:hypothetical protein
MERFRQMKKEADSSKTLCKVTGVPHVWKDYGVDDSICESCREIRHGRSWRKARKADFMGLGDL